MRRALLLLLAACGAGATDTDADGRPTTGDGSDATVDATALGEAPLARDQQAGRPAKRMDLEQLVASLETTTGLGWTETVGGTPRDLFDRLSLTLGEPDYQSATDVDLAPGLLFQKFLGDAAAEICHARVRLDLEAAPADRRFLVSVAPGDTSADDPAGVDATLTHNLLVFHGRRVAAGSDHLALWRDLFDGVVADTNDPTEAWTTVCVGLITHPDFAMY